MDDEIDHEKWWNRLSSLYEGLIVRVQPGKAVPPNEKCSCLLTSVEK
jgi:hypothetical protein